MALAEQFPWNTPNNTDSIQQLLYRLAMIATVEGAATSPGVRGWGAFQQTVAGGSSYTSLKNVKCRSVLLTNYSAAQFDISQDGTNFYRLAAQPGNSVTIQVKENAAEILIKRDDNAALPLICDVLYFT